MQIRCYSCHTPFSLNREAAIAALDSLSAENHNHFNAHCPRCRKANRISRQQLLRAVPGWVPPDERPDPAAAEEDPGKEAEK
jgi:hypothetical protein